MMKITILLVTILIVMPTALITIPRTEAYMPVLDEVLGLDRRNAIYMLIRNTTWDIRGDQDMDLNMLLNIRCHAEKSIALMTIIPGPNPLLSLRLSYAIFLLAILFNIEDGENFQHTLELYREMIVPTRKGINAI